MSKFRLDGEEFDIDLASEEAQRLVRQIIHLDRVANEKSMLLASLQRAKLAYESDIKSEIIRTTTGVDLLSD